MSDGAGLTWRCQCGARMWLHHEHCNACGRERPKPSPAEPSNDTRREPPAPLQDPPEKRANQRP